jgi:hypothetical protein
MPVVSAPQLTFSFFFPTTLDVRSLAIANVDRILRAENTNNNNTNNTNNNDNRTTRTRTHWYAFHYDCGPYDHFFEGIANNQMMCQYCFEVRRVGGLASTPL